MAKYDFNKVAFPVNLLHIFRTPFPRKTFEGLLLSRINFDRFCRT